MKLDETPWFVPSSTLQGSYFQKFLTFISELIKYFDLLLQIISEHFLSNDKTFNLQVKCTQPKLYALTLVPAVLIFTLNKKKNPQNF